MNLLKSIWLFVVVAMATQVLAEDDDELMIPMSKDFFYKNLKKPEGFLVFFEAPWCMNCAMLYPMIKKLVPRLQDTKLYRVNCKNEETLCRDERVDHMPLFRVYQYGKGSSYFGKMEDEPIFKWVKRAKEPRIHTVDLKGLDKLVEDGLTVVAFAKDKASPMLPVVNELSSQLWFTHTHAFVTDEAALKKYKVDSDAIVLFKPYDDKMVVYKGDTKPHLVQRWVQRETLQYLPDVDGNDMSDIRRTELPMGLFFYNKTEELKAAQSVLDKTAKAFRANMTMATIRVGNNTKFAEKSGCYNELPCFTVVEVTKKGVYPLMDQFSQSTVDGLVKEVLSGEAEHHHRTEPVPDKQEGPFTKIVGLTWNKIAKDTSKDVFVHVWESWCVHCKRADKAWKEIQTKFSRADTLVLAKFDHEKNDLPPAAGFDLDGVPTLVLYKAKTNEMVKFTKDFTTRNFVEFLKEHATHKEVIKTWDVSGYPEYDDDWHRQEL